MAIKYQLPTLCSIAAASLFVTACDSAKPSSYQIPKETREVSMPTPPAAETQAPAAPNGMNVLPGMKEAAQAAGDLKYRVPEGWVELPASGIRKANLRIDDDNGSAELTVTVFPGDVGGRLANINRWRGQIGLDSVTAEDLDAFTESYSISKHRGIIVTLEGGIDSIIGGLLPFHGNTWFFKLQGKTDTVLASKEHFKAFLDSVELPDGHH
ncbi:MAG TPA: hypothetical protein DCX06_11075 [Opitutae bacterium]|nr:hypothetical protein [Opitutae bacterium]